MANCILWVLLVTQTVDSLLTTTTTAKQLKSNCQKQLKSGKHENKEWQSNTRLLKEIKKTID